MTGTDDLVDRFAVALKEKLRAAEKKYGYSDEWKHDDWRADLIACLQGHVEKGDPRDVAAYCAFAWHHGWSITPPDTGGVSSVTIATDARTNALKRAARELDLIASTEIDAKVREGVDRAVQHLKGLV